MRLSGPFAVRSILALLSTCAIGAAACSSSSSPPPQQDAGAAPVRLRIHHEPGGLVFINPTPVECTVHDGPFGPDASANGPEVDECDVPASEEVEPVYWLGAHPRYAWRFGGWKITPCDGPPVTIDTENFPFRPGDYARDGGRCLVEVDLRFVPRSPDDGGLADGDGGGGGG